MTYPVPIDFLKGTEKVRGIFTGGSTRAVQVFPVFNVRKASLLALIFSVLGIFSQRLFGRQRGILGQGIFTLLLGIIWKL